MGIFRGRDAMEGGYPLIIIWVIVAIVYFPLGVIFELTKKYK